MAVVEQLIRERDAARAELSPLLDEITRLRDWQRRAREVLSDARYIAAKYRGEHVRNGKFLDGALLAAEIDGLLNESEGDK